MHPARALVAALCLAVAAFAACAYPDATGPVGDVMRVEFPTAADTIITGAAITPDDTLRLTATVLSNTGVPLAAPTIAWSTSDPGVVIVDSTGLAQATGTGEALVVAASGGRADTIAIAVLRTPPSLEIDSVYTRISAGRDFTCATTTLGRSYCWGIDSVRQLGAFQSDTVCLDAFGAVRLDAQGNARIDWPCSLVPLRVEARTLTLAQPAAGGMHGCALTSDGEAICWGLSDSGQVGNGRVGPQPPSPVSTSLRFDSLDTGEEHTCGLLSSGAAWCWGSDRGGMLGNGIRVASSTTPIPVEGGLAFRSISAGVRNTCAVTSAGAAYCWGSNARGQLGRGHFGDSTSVPAAVLGAPPLSTVSVNGHTACGIAAAPGAAGTAYCWGAGQLGQFGNGRADSSAAPRAVVTDVAFRDIAVGESHVCALTAAGEVVCWGTYDVGNLLVDVPGYVRFQTPRRVGAALTFASITSGRRHSCGVTPDGKAYCWGSNVLGPLGDGLQARFSPEPQQVRTPR